MGAWPGGRGAPTYLNGVRERGTHSVPSRHCLRQDLRTLKLGINDLQATDTRFHDHVRRKTVQTLHFIVKVTVGEEILSSQLLT